MDNEQVLQNNTKENYVKKLNASNEAKRLEEKVKAYDNNLRKNNSLNNGSKSSGLTSTKESKPVGSVAKSTTSLKYGTSGNSTNSKMTNELASKGVQAAGVPKPLADAVVNSKVGQKAIESVKKKNPALNMLDKLMGGGQKETEEQASDGGGVNFKISAKVIKWVLISMSTVYPVIIFICLFTTASQIYYNSIGLGNADSVSQRDAEEKIDKAKDDDLNEEIRDEDAYLIGNPSIIKNIKLENSNLVKLASKKITERPGNEADLSELGDYYSTIDSYLDEGYKKEDVYTFFYKLLYIQKAYSGELDMALLMATLRIQSSDMAIVFSSNIKDYNQELKENNPDFGYAKDWSGYITNKNISTHDIEVLAQNMVSNQVKETCVDSSGKETKSNILKDSEIGNQTLTCSTGETYKTEKLGLVKDDDKYREFLKEFLEKKYYLDTDTPISGNNNVAPSENNSSSNNNSGNSSSKADNKFARAMIDLANNEYKNNQGYSNGLKYTNALGFAPGTPWCAMFVWYLTRNTKVDGKYLSPDIIPFGSASTGTYMASFNNSDRSNINFYYNDNCSKLAGKNNSNTKYTPKPGDFIFFDWEARFSSLSSGEQDHTAFIEKYENGVIYTIEGNMSNTILKRKYDINNCQVIGFGSWY